MNLIHTQEFLWLVKSNGIKCNIAIQQEIIQHVTGQHFTPNLSFLKHLGLKLEYSLGLQFFFVNDYDIKCVVHQNVFVC